MGDIDRQKFLEAQISPADETFEWTSGEQDAREQFMRLAMDTHDFLIGSEFAHVQIFYLSPDAGGKPFTRNYPLRRIYWSAGPGIALSGSQIDRWENWKRDYREIRARDPRLDLRDMISHISYQTLYPEAWPVGLERRIQTWIDAGDPFTPLADLGQNFVTPEFFARLHKLRRRCDGWMYWDSDRNQLVFASEPEWRQVLSEQAP
jgi:hypothetical protein